MFRCQTDGSSLPRTELLQDENLGALDRDSPILNEPVQMGAAGIGFGKLPCHVWRNPDIEVLQQSVDEACGRRIDPERGIECCILLHLPRVSLHSAGHKRS